MDTAANPPMIKIIVNMTVAKFAEASGFSRRTVI
jgi:hypothetical protein